MNSDYLSSIINPPIRELYRETLDNKALKCNNGHSLDSGDNNIDTGVRVGDRNRDKNLNQNTNNASSSRSNGNSIYTNKHNNKTDRNNNIGINNDKCGNINI